jgi:hypothetical protein
VKLRLGRKLGRTIYVQHGDEPSDEDILVGMMDTEIWAATLVEAYNDHLARITKLTKSRWYER